MRILFAGTPEAAVPSLRALIDSPHEVVGVLTRPDAPLGRGRTLHPSPVRVVAEEARVPVLTPRGLKSAEVQQHLRDLQADLAVVVAYGVIIPPAALDIPRHGWVNLHFSLLPAWRGAAPAQRAVLAGQETTGLSIFRIEAGLDTGPVVSTSDVAIGPHETSGQLLERMATLGADALVAAATAIGDGTATFTPQDDDGATYAQKLTPAQAHVDWTAPAEDVDALIRGMSPDPGAWTTWNGSRFKLLGTEETRSGDAPSSLLPGQLQASRKQLVVGTGTVPVAISTVAPAGKKPMRAADWARGAHLTAGSTFDGDLEGQQA
jgi:methionyl-tRNA formyltransferase